MLLVLYLTGTEKLFKSLLINIFPNFIVFPCSGYMPPEYAVHGSFSIKSDVFSFGVVVLEIISGRKNRGFSDPQHHLNLLGHVSFKCIYSSIWSCIIYGCFPYIFILSE